MIKCFRDYWAIISVWLADLQGLPDPDPPEEYRE